MQASALHVTVCVMWELFVNVLCDILFRHKFLHDHQHGIHQEDQHRQQEELHAATGS